MLTAECPCCHGAKELEVVCEDMRNCPTIYFPCNHCDDTGRVKIKLPVESRSVKTPLSKIMITLRKFSGLIKLPSVFKS
jgi:hypothetical protein